MVLKVIHFMWGINNRLEQCLGSTFHSVKLYIYIYRERYIYIDIDTDADIDIDTSNRQ